jgi:hypothetical protein
MDERQKIEWAQQDKKLLLLLERQQALPTNHPFSMAKLGEEIIAVEKLLRFYRVLRANEARSHPVATKLASPKHLGLISPTPDNC